MAFTKAEIEVMRRLLELAFDKFSDHGCNDMELEDTPEMRAVVTGVLDEDEEVIIYEDKILTGDHRLMHYLAERCQEEIDNLNADDASEVETRN